MVNRGPNLNAPSVVNHRLDSDTTPAPFQVVLGVFDGPLSLLLSLIQKHELDITDVSLSLVTDEFITYIAEFQDRTELGIEQASEFLEVAATLLDLKIARLLPQGEPVDAEDADLFEARDLLFARLLQYRAFSQISQWFGEQLSVESQRHTRAVPLDPQYRSTGTELIWKLSLQEFADMAAAVSTPQKAAEVELSHLHITPVSLKEQTAAVVLLLQQNTELTFAQLLEQPRNVSITVARFLVLLELYRRDAVRFTQADPLGSLRVTWIAEQWSDSAIATLGEYLG